METESFLDGRDRRVLVSIQAGQGHTEVEPANLQADGTRARRK